LAALAIGVLIGRAPAEAPSENKVIHVPLALPPGVAIPYGYTPRLAISPDGLRIAYIGLDERGAAIYVQDLKSPGSAEPVEGTSEAVTPFFSPDSESLGYLRRSGIEIVSLSGGKPRSLVAGVSFVGGNATWGSDDWIYYVDATSGIERVQASGGSSPHSLKSPAPGEAYDNPRPLPGGRHVLHAIWQRDQGRPCVAVTAIASGEQTILFEGGFSPRYVPTGHLLVAQEDMLLGMTFDPETLKVGSPVPVLRGLTTDFGEGVADYAVSESGSLTFLTGALEQEGWLVRLTPGKESERLNRQPADFDYLPIDLSTGGRRVALGRNDLDVWIFDLESKDLDVRVTTDPTQEWNPVWEPSGEALAFASQQGGGWSIHSRSADGLGAVQPLVEDRRAQKWPRSWSPDGKVLLFDQLDRESGVDLWLVEAGQPGSARPFLQTPSAEYQATFSSDGQWVAYSSNESGRSEVYVTSYPDGRIKRKVSRDGGADPRWSADSGRLFYASRGRVMVVEALDDRWGPSQPEVFVEAIDAILTWDVAPDGQSVIALERRPAPRLHLVQNSVEELKRLVPANE
jgi:Tol biopolymer transport system component